MIADFKLKLNGPQRECKTIREDGGDMLTCLQKSHRPRHQEAHPTTCSSLSVSVERPPRLSLSMLLFSRRLLRQTLLVFWQRWPV